MRFSGMTMLRCGVRGMTSGLETGCRSRVGSGCSNGAGFEVVDVLLRDADQVVIGAW